MTTDRQLRLLLLTMCAALALVLAGNSSLTIALPDLARDLGASQTDLTWVINAYAVTFAAVLLPAGIAADRFGRRWFIAAGLALFGAASLLSGFAEETWLVIALRAAAGLGAAAVFPVTLSALIDAYPPERRAFAVSVWAGVSGAGATLGSLAAGLLLEVAWWGSVQVAFGALALLLVPVALRTVANARNPRLALDPVGGVLAAVGLGALVYGVIEGGERGFASTPALAGMGAGALLLAAFVAWELRTREPMLDVRLFGSRGLSTGSTLVSLQFFAMFGFFFLAPQLLQVVKGYSPLAAAAALLPLTLGVGLATPAVPRLVAGIGAGRTGAAGAATLAAGFAALAFVPPDAPFLAFAAVFVVLGTGFGLALTPGTTLIVDGLPEDRRTLSSAVNDVTREVGGALGSSVLGALLVTVYQARITDALTGVPERVSAAAQEGIAGAYGAAQQAGPDAQRLLDAARDAFADGVQVALLAGAGVLLVAALICVAFAPDARATADPELAAEPVQAA